MLTEICSPSLSSAAHSSLPAPGRQTDWSRLWPGMAQGEPSASALPGDLLHLLYQSLQDALPWQRFAEGLRRLLGARNVVITLHHEQQTGCDSYVMAGIADDPIDWQAVEEEYRSNFMALDPMRLDRMAPGQVERLTVHLTHSHFAQKLGFTDSMRLCVAEPQGMRCWVDMVRCDAQQPLFSAGDMALLQALVPHMETALSLFARLQRQETERFVYESMLDHFGLGCVLLNGAGQVLHMNPVATQLVQRVPGLSVQEHRLRLKDRAVQRRLEQAIEKVVLAREQGQEEANGEILRMGQVEDHLLGILVQSAPVRHYYRGQETPCAIVYLSEIHTPLQALQPAQSHSVQRICSLFDLTRQEATLSLLLACGHTIAEAAQKMQIGESAARNYSKKVYGKLAISSQADLVRVMLRSLSFLR
ncbi:MAG: hypothetical protein JO200_06695 [Comamonas sp.]|nr:hypothetical protein [Comamonas sp.]